MAEEVEGEVKEEPGKKEAPPEPNPVEDLAKEMGWNPDHEGEDAVDAKTFIRRGRDINRAQSKRIKSLGKELTALNEGIGTIHTHLESQHKAEVEILKDQINDLKAKRKDAIAEADVDEAEKLDGKIKTLEKKADQPPPEAPTAASNPALDEWMDENPWFNDDPEMGAWANAYAMTPTMSAMKAANYDKFLKTVEHMAKKTFPEKFEAKEPEKKAPAAAAVAAPTPKKQKGKKATAKDLSYEQRKVGEEFVNQEVYNNLDEYAQALQKRYGDKS